MGGSVILHMNTSFFRVYKGPLVCLYRYLEEPKAISRFNIHGSEILSIAWRFRSGAERNGLGYVDTFL